MRIEADIIKSSRQWVFYLLRDQQNEIHFAGVCAAAQLLALPDVRGNALFESMFKNRLAVIDVIEFCDTRMLAINARARYLGNHAWPLMNRYSGKNGRGAPIFCNETNETFKNMDEVVAAHGIHASNLSKHLNGKTGHRTVGGRTYTRLSATPAVLSPTQQPSPPIAIPLHILPGGKS